MKPYQERVIAEKSELDEKRTKLRAFVMGPIFPTLDGAEQARMQRQSVAMTEYSNALGERIAAFTT